MYDKRGKSPWIGTWHPLLRWIYAAEMDDTELNQKLVGSTIEVWWPNDHMFYPGVVHAYHPETKKHRIVYDDGEVETLILKDERWQIVNSIEADKVQENPILRPNMFSKRSIKVSDHKSNSVSGSKVIREATTVSMKISKGRDERSTDFLTQKRPFAKSETMTEKTDLKLSKAANQKLKKVKVLKGNSILVAGESSTKERKSKMAMNTCSSQSVPQDPLPSPSRTGRGKFGDSGEKVLDSHIDVPNITRTVTTGMAKEDKSHPEVISTRNILVTDEETGDLRAIEAKKRLQREKHRSRVPDMSKGVTLPLTPKTSTGDVVNIDLPKHIFDSAFMEKIRVFSEINQNKWYKIDSEPLPNYVVLADEFGQDAAFDHSNLFKTIRQTPHYGGLDKSDTKLLEDLWYKLPLVFEALHKSFKDQRYLIRNIETMRGWLSKLGQAGFNVSIPYAAFDLLTKSQVDFANFKKALNSVTIQLSKEQQNVEALKPKLPISERVAQLDSKIEDLKQQLRELKSERMSLEQLRSMELEYEKYGTTLKARRLQKLKEFYEKELVEAGHFLREVSLDGWYQCAEL